VLAKDCVEPVWPTQPRVRSSQAFASEPSYLAGRHPAKAAKGLFAVFNHVPKDAVRVNDFCLSYS